MRVNVFMIPTKDLSVINLHDTIGDAIKAIDEHRMLSLPVLDGEKFVGVLSKGNLYEAFFTELSCSKEEFMSREIASFVKTDVISCSIETRLEEAAALFLSSEVRFIPVTDASNHLLGIITQQAVFKQYRSLFDSKYNSITLVLDNYKGALARLGEIISNAGGNIVNFVQVDTDLMNLIELHISIDAPNFDTVLDALSKHKFDVREIIRK